jgi:hypothetical protein
LTTSRFGPLGVGCPLGTLCSDNADPGSKDDDESDNGNGNGAGNGNGPGDGDE